MQENNMPRPSMNPLDDLDELPESPAPKKNTKGKKPPPPPPEDDLAHEEHDDSVQRGMPGRNLKNWAIAILGLAVAGSMLWPQSNSNKDKTLTAKQAEASIADELERSKPVVAALEETVVPEPPAPPPIVKIAPEPKENKDDEKMALILASPMGTDVQLSNGSGKPKEKPAPADPLEGFDRSKMIEDAMREQERMMAAMAAAEASSKKKPDGLHEGFLKESKGIEAPIGMVGARKPNTIYEGTLIRTVLTRKLQTDLPGMVTAKVMSDVYDSVTMQTMLIPRGSEVTCRYQSELLVGQEVVLAACERLRLPNGKSFSLMSTPASDMQGASGLPADVNNHFFKMFGTSLMLGAASLLLPEKDQKITVSSSNGSQEKGGSILGTALHDTITTILQRNARIPPTGTVEIGTPFTLTISRDVEMEPYTGR